MPSHRLARVAFAHAYGNRRCNSSSLPGAILDDDDLFRRLAAESLRVKGFMVDTAKNPEEGVARIDSQNYHVLIFDIVMGTKFNRDWLDLLGKLRAESKVDSSLVVVISAYISSGEAVHEVLIDYQADDAIDKTKFHIDTFGEQMWRLADRKMKLNRSLRVAWNRGQPEAAAAVVNLKVGSKRVKADSEDFARCQEELDDLFCRLFWRAESILVSRLPVGRSGAGVVKVQPVVRGIALGSVVVKFGDHTDIKTESANYDEYVSGMLGGSRSPSIAATARTRLLGGIVYSFLGAEEFEPFAFVLRIGVTG